MRPLSTAARENRMVTSAERLEQCATLDEAEEVSNDGAECKTTRTEESYTTNFGGMGPGRTRNELAKVVSACPVIYSFSYALPPLVASVHADQLLSVNYGVLRLIHAPTPVLGPIKPRFNNSVDTKEIPSLRFAHYHS